MNENTNVKTDQDRVAVENRIKVCPYFKHDPLHADKASPLHIHLCTSKKNTSRRCGYNNSWDSWTNCPIARELQITLYVKNTIEYLVENRGYISGDDTLKAVADNFSTICEEKPEMLATTFNNQGVNVFITAPSGAGKSTLVKELRALGILAFDTDNLGKKDEMNKWIVEPWRITALLDIVQGPIILIGASHNLAELFQKFHKSVMFVLWKVDLATIAERGLRRDITEKRIPLEGNQPRTRTWYYSEADKFYSYFDKLIKSQSNGFEATGVLLDLIYYNSASERFEHT